MSVGKKELAEIFGARLLEPGTADAMEALSVSLHIHEAMLSARDTARRFGCTGFALCAVESDDEEAPCKDAGLVLHWTGVTFSEDDGFRTTSTSPEAIRLRNDLDLKMDDIARDVSDFRFGGWGRRATENLVDEFEGELFGARVSEETLAARTLPPDIWAIIQATVQQAELSKGSPARRPRHKA